MEKYQDKDQKKKEIKIQDKRQEKDQLEHLASTSEKKKSFETSELDRERFKITKEVEEFVKDKLLLSVCTQGRELIGAWTPNDDRTLLDVLTNDKYLVLDMARECFRQKVGGDRVNRILVKDDYDTSYIALT
ncbi:MAG: hypothetical protein ACTSQE_16590, partial [Candidatus Heimdallarchaeaceae archaeon]